MKKRNLKIVLAILFTVVLCLGCCLGCRELGQFIDPLGFEERPDETLKKDEYYAMDAQTILQDVTAGKPIQLTLVPGEQELQPHEYPPVVSWKQADYLQVASAVFLSAWEETPADWKLDKIFSRTTCMEWGFGFQWMFFTFFKVEKNEETNMYFRTQRDMFISPEKNLIWIYEVETSPVSPLKLWESGLEVDKIIPAEEVIRIVEGNGGLATRTGIERCSIRADIVAGVNDDNWQVWYESSRGNFFFGEVDEKTGEISR